MGLLETLGGALPSVTDIANGFLSAREAGLNRDSNRDEAQKTRDWQTEMSNTAYQRAKADMLKAGINPALALGAGGASTPSGATASSNSMPQFKSGENFNIAQLKANIENTKANIENTKANTAVAQKEQIKKDAETKNIDIDSEIKRLSGGLTTAQTSKTNTENEIQKTESKYRSNKIQAEINEINKDIEKKQQEIQNLKADKDFTKAKTAEKELDVMNYRLQKQIDMLKSAGLTNPLGVAEYIRMFGVEPYRNHNSAQSVKRSHLLGGNNATIRAR